MVQKLANQNKLFDNYRKADSTGQPRLVVEIKEKLGRQAMVTSSLVREARDVECGAVDNDNLDSGESTITNLS